MKKYNRLTKIDHLKKLNTKKHPNTLLIFHNYENMEQIYIYQINGLPKNMDTHWLWSIIVQYLPILDTLTIIKHKITPLIWNKQLGKSLSSTFEGQVYMLLENYNTKNKKLINHIIQLTKDGIIKGLVGGFILQTLLSSNTIKKKKEKYSYNIYKADLDILCDIEPVFSNLHNFFPTIIKNKYANIHSVKNHHYMIFSNYISKILDIHISSDNAISYNNTIINRLQLIQTNKNISNIPSIVNEYDLSCCFVCYTAEGLHIGDPNGLVNNTAYCNINYVNKRFKLYLHAKLSNIKISNDELKNQFVNNIIKFSMYIYKLSLRNNFIKKINYIFNTQYDYERLKDLLSESNFDIIDNISELYYLNTNIKKILLYSDTKLHMSYEDNKNIKKCIYLITPIIKTIQSHIYRVKKYRTRHNILIDTSTYYEYIV